MNWGLVWWFVGIMATFAALKFVMVFFKSIFNKENMQNVIYKAGDGISGASEKMTERMKAKMEQRKQQKREENRAIVIQR